MISGSSTGQLSDPICDSVTNSLGAFDFPPRRHCMSQGPPDSLGDKGESWFVPARDQSLPVIFRDLFHTQEFYAVWLIALWSPYSWSPEPGGKL